MPTNEGGSITSPGNTTPSWYSEYASSIQSAVTSLDTAENAQGQDNPLFGMANTEASDGSAGGTSAYPKWIRHLDVIEDNPLDTGGQISSFTYSVESQILRGTMAFSKSKLQELDPSYTGYTHVFCVRVPPVLTQVARGKQIAGFDGTTGVERGRQHCINLKALFEMGCTGYSGTPDLTLNTSPVNIGWNDRQYAAPTYSEYGSTDFTLKVLECRGDPLRRGIEYWTSAVSDPNLKAATMNGATNDDGTRLLAPTLANFTWTFMIVQTDQTMLTIQDISLWNSCLIKGIDRGNLDWENGQIDIVQPRDVQFSGVYMPDCRNKYLRKMAELLLGMRLKYYKRYQDMGYAEIGTKEWDTIGTTFETGS